MIIYYVYCLLTLGAHWNRYYQEIEPTPHKDGFYDLPLDGSDWLTYFKHQNLSLLQELDVCGSHFIFERKQNYFVCFSHGDLFLASRYRGICLLQAVNKPLLEILYWGQLNL